MIRTCSVALVLGLIAAGCRSGAGPAPGERAAAAAPAKPSAPAPGSLAVGVKRVELDNGLIVLLRESHEVPVVSTMVWYRIGSADEADNESGIAHFLEHMMFKGTQRYRKLEIDRITQRNGGQNNAFTSKEHTAYFFDFASDRWEAALEIESDRMRNCLLDGKEFESERQVVIEELRRRLDTPWERLDQEVELRAFPGHAYGHPVIGWKKDLDALTRERMASYYDRYYHPNHAVLVLAGDFDTGRALARVRELFGPIPRGPEPARRATAPAGGVQEHVVDIASTHNLDRLMVAFRASPLRAEDDAALDVLTTLLGDGRSSRLHRRLVETDRLAADIGCWYDARRVDGLVTVTAELLPGNAFEAVERAIEAELARVRDGEVPERELQKAKNQLLADFVFSKESAHGVANALGHFEITAGGYDYLDRYREKIEAVTAADVQAAARRHVTAERAVTGRSKAARQQGRRAGGSRIADCGLRIDVGGGGEGERSAGRKGGRMADCGRRGAGREVSGPPFPVFGPVRFVGGPPGGGTDSASDARDRRSSVIGHPSAAVRHRTADAGVKPIVPGGGAAKFNLPPILRKVLPNGLTVLALRRPGTPAFAARAFVDAGLLVEPEAKAGVARIVSELLAEGTAGRTGPEIAEAIEFVGGDLSPSPTGPSGKALAKDAGLLLDLMSDILRQPVFPEDAFARVKEQTLSDIAGEDDRPAVTGRKLFMERVYGAHPLHRPVLGYAPTVRALTREDAVRHHAAFYRPRNTIVAVVGDEPPEELAARVEAAFGVWADTGPAAKPPLPAVARQREPAEAVQAAESAQAHIYLGHLGIRRNHPDYHALLVMDNVLGLGAGFTDRMSKRIRDELGLAYQVYATISRTATVEPGTFQVYIGTRPEKKDEAVREAKATLATFVAAGPTEEEVAEAKAYLMGSYVFEYESAVQLADYLIAVERFGLGLDYLQTYAARIAAVTTEEAARVARTHLDPEALTAVVVCPGKKE